MAQIPKSGEVYRHFKGTKYVIVDTAIHTETGEKLVIYRSLDEEGKTFARPLDMFISRVDTEKYPDAIQKYRFEKIEPHYDDKEKDEVCSESI